MGTAGGAGFGGAFLQGLTGALAAGRERKQQQEQRRQQNALAAVNFLMNSGQVGDIADLEPILSTAIPEVFGDTTGKGKKAPKGQPAVDHKGMITQVLSSALGGNMGSIQIPDAGVGNDLPSQGGITGTLPRGPMFTGPIPQSGEGADPLPSKPLSSGLPSPGATPRRTLGGVPLLTPDEASQRAVDRETRQSEQQITAKVNLARRLLPTFQAIDPKFTLEDAMASVGLKTQRDTGATTRYQQVRGMVDGKETFGVFDPSTAQYLDPTTKEPIAGFAPLTANSTYHYGVDREAAAKRLFDKGYGELTSEQRTAADKLVNENAGAKAGATTTARAQAEATAPLSSADRFAKTRELQGDWRKVSAPAEESKRSLARMEIGLRRFKDDPTGAAETIRVGFEKILDPSSVVREGEYARQGNGLSLLQMMEGYRQRLIEGGGSIPYDVLAGMVETARQFDEGQRMWTDLERDRIGRLAQTQNLPEDAIFGSAAAQAAGTVKAPTEKKPEAGATIPGYTWKDGALYLNGKKIQ